MLIELLLTHREINAEAIKNKICVVIDTLRATSTIITAFSRGCREIIPVKSLEDARQLNKREAYRSYSLGGETELRPPDNFDLGNSPLEYLKTNLQGKGLIFRTTNGTRALQKTGTADTVIICALLNAGAVAQWLGEQNKELVICCAGTRGAFSLEDFLTAGRLIIDLNEKADNFIPSDLAFTAGCFYTYIQKKAGRGNGMAAALKKTANGQRLLQAGLEKDLLYCSQEDILPLLPFYQNGSIRLLEV
ncbi:MAG: 2-phosphosulfolactate phosphatase [Dethiobacteria bacterium]|jgi:2-phosphosulfolactate phosphatase